MPDKMMMMMMMMMMMLDFAHKEKRFQFSNTRIFSQKKLADPLDTCFKKTKETL
jgi:hypothetical protein